MNRILRIAGIVIVLVLVLLIAVIGYVFAQSNAKLNATHNYEVVTFDIPDDEDILVEGQRIWESRACGDCHGGDAGGNPDFINDGAIGVLPASNLTSGEGGHDYTADDFVLAIQHGVGHDGRGLIIMPSEDWYQMPEAELMPLVAYLLSLEPIDRTMPERSLGPIGRALVAFGAFPLTVETIDHANAGFLDIEAEPSIEYGEYVARNCVGCHGDNFGGQAVPGEQDVVSANITSHPDGIGDWSLDDWITAMREGTRPDGSVIDAAHMPWPYYASMTDVELEALYNFLQSREAIAGN